MLKVSHSSAKCSGRTKFFSLRKSTRHPHEATVQLTSKCLIEGKQSLANSIEPRRGHTTWSGVSSHTFHTEGARLTQDFSFLRKTGILFRNEGDLTFVLFLMHTIEVIYREYDDEDILSNTKYWQFFKQFLPKETVFKHWFSSHQESHPHVLNRMKRSILVRQLSLNSRDSNLGKSTLQPLQITYHK